MVERFSHHKKTSDSISTSVACILGKPMVSGIKVYAASGLEAQSILRDTSTSTACIPVASSNMSQTKPILWWTVPAGITGASPLRFLALCFHMYVGLGTWISRIMLRCFGIQLLTHLAWILHIKHRPGPSTLTCVCTIHALTHNKNDRWKLEPIMPNMEPVTKQPTSQFSYETGLNSVPASRKHYVPHAFSTPTQIKCNRTPLQTWSLELRKHSSPMAHSS